MRKLISKKFPINKGTKRKIKSLKEIKTRIRKLAL